ncbi:hypothetical protein GC197_16720 [bacterium]|nr:hypothetical protein [bacterium]
MNWTLRQWLALAWIVLLHALLYSTMVTNFWDYPNLLGLDDFLLILVILVVPITSAGILGVWLTAGVGPGWLRLISVVAGQVLLIWAMVSAVPADPISIVPGLAICTATVAMGTFFLGCLGSVLPMFSLWNVRFALWEIIATVSLMGVVFAIIKYLVAVETWNWSNWHADGGYEFLTFALFSGLIITITLVPLLVRRMIYCIIASAGLLISLVVMPPIEAAIFTQLGLEGGELELFYPVHLGQAGMMLAITIPLVVAFPGFLVRIPTKIDSESPESLADESTDEEDFAQM